MSYFDLNFHVISLLNHNQLSLVLQTSNLQTLPSFEPEDFIQLQKLLLLPATLLYCAIQDTVSLVKLGIEVGGAKILTSLSTNLGFLLGQKFVCIGACISFYIENFGIGDSELVILFFVKLSLSLNL